mgnify:CR=1 FL=1
MRLGIAGKLIGMAALFILFMVAVGGLATFNTGQVAGRSAAMYSDAVVPLETLQVGDIVRYQLGRVDVVHRIKAITVGADGQLTSAAITARLTGGHNGGASAIRAISFSAIGTYAS